MSSRTRSCRRGGGVGRSRIGDFDFSAGQSVTQGRGGQFSQRGSTVIVTNPGWSADLVTGASTTPGFTGRWSGSNPVPSSFKLNGTTCTGSTTPTSTATTTTTTTTTTTSNNPNPPAGLVGWATQNGGTTGDGAAGTVNVGNSSAVSGRGRRWSG